jgi:hypothetical protein
VFRRLTPPWWTWTGARHRLRGNEGAQVQGRHVQDSTGHAVRLVPNRREGRSLGTIMALAPYGRLNNLFRTMPEERRVAFAEIMIKVGPLRPATPVVSRTWSRWVVRCRCR